MRILIRFRWVNSMLQELVSDLTIYTQQDYHHFVGRYADKIHSMEAHLLQEEPNTYVRNVNTHMMILGGADDAWPISLNNKEYTNALICSPYTTYVKYPLDIISKFDQWWFRSWLLLSVKTLDLLCKVTKINCVVQVNNNLNSLLKHPTSFSRLIPRLTSLLTQRYPQHAVLFFRVNKMLDESLLHVLQKQGYIVFPDRAAHLFLPGQPYMNRSYTKRDIALLNKTHYTIVPHDDLREKDVDRICELYRKLFIEKYSKFSPDYTRAFFHQAILHRWHHYTAWRHPNGQIDAFVSWFYRDQVMICGPLGYDTQKDKKAGLYRMSIAWCLKYAHEQQLIFNLGAGSDQFKLNRGSVKVLEYTAVYCRHLPLYRHIPWWTLRWAFALCARKLFEANTM